MRGSPPLRVLLVVMALLAVLWPLRSLTTHRTEESPDISQKVAAAQSSVRLVLTSTTFPFTFEISHLGKTIWKGEATESSVAREVKMTFPPEGIDLLLDARWQEEKQTAVKLEVTPEAGDAITRTLWGTTQVNGVLTFAKP
jgi:hypothetical protein